MSLAVVCVAAASAMFSHVTYDVRSPHAVRTFNVEVAGPHTETVGLHLLAHNASTVLRSHASEGVSADWNRMVDKHGVELTRQFVLRQLFEQMLANLSVEIEFYGMAGSAVTAASLEARIAGIETAMRLTSVWPFYADEMSKLRAAVMKTEMDRAREALSEVYDLHYRLVGAGNVMHHVRVGDNSPIPQMGETVLRPHTTFESELFSKTQNLRSAPAWINNLLRDLVEQYHWRLDPVARSDLEPEAARFGPRNFTLDQWAAEIGHMVFAMHNHPPTPVPGQSLHEYVRQFLGIPSAPGWSMYSEWYAQMFMARARFDTKKLPSDSAFYPLAQDFTPTLDKPEPNPDLPNWFIALLMHPMNFGVLFGEVDTAIDRYEAWSS